MKFISVLLSLAAVAVALPSQKRGQCANISIRKEWRSLSQQERDQFHSAVKQLQKEPSDVQGQSLFDRFSRLHVEMSDDIHYTAAFMTWHRYYCYAREQSLRKVGYAGPIPYWDWTKDAGNLAASEVLSPTAGFGGNGSPTYDSSGNVYNCVQDGPYGVKSNFSIAYPQQHCLQRKFRQSNRFGGASQYSAAKIQNVMRNTRFVDFWHALEGGAHDSVHTDIAGDMAAAFSPDDSLFFMHHNNVDRLWAMWQAQNPARLTEYTGNIYQGQRDDDGSRYPLASLNDTISLRGLGDMPDVKVRDIMDTTSPTLCYTYDK